MSTTSRAEITSWYAKAYVKAGKKDKGRILDEVVGVTGWSRDNARRRLTGAAKRRPGSGRQVARLDGLERHGELVDGDDRYSPAVRAELLSMSAASIDRYLKPTTATDQLRGKTTTKSRRCAPRSRSARPVTRSKPSPDSSRATPSRTAGRR